MAALVWRLYVRDNSKNFPEMMLFSLPSRKSL